MKENNLILTNKDFNILLNKLSIKLPLYYKLNNIFDIMRKAKDLNIKLDSLKLNQNDVKTTLYVNDQEIDLLIETDDTFTFQMIYNSKSNHVLISEYQTQKRSNKLCMFYLDNNNNNCDECYLTIKYKDLERLINSYFQIMSAYEQKLKDQMSKKILNEKKELNDISNTVLNVSLAGMSIFANTISNN